MIELKNVLPIPLKEMPGGISPASKIFGTHCFFEKGKHYLVEAPSGRGKSTLLHIIYGLRTDFEGTVHFDGQDIRQFQPNDWAANRQTHLSLVFQDLRLFPQLTALENILLKSGLTAAIPEPQVKLWAARLGVEENLGQTAATLSYGQRQRIAIIRALCQPFDFLLLDEPFSHLDEENTRLASQLILEICRAQQAGLILVSLGERYIFEYDEIWVL